MQDFGCGMSGETFELHCPTLCSNSSDINPGTRLRERISASSADDILELVARSRTCELQIGLTLASEDDDVICSADCCPHMAA